MSHRATSPAILPPELLYSIFDGLDSCWGNWDLFHDSEEELILAAPGLRWYLNLRLVNRSFNAIIFPKFLAWILAPREEKMDWHDWQYRRPGPPTDGSMAMGRQILGIILQSRTSFVTGKSPAFHVHHARRQYYHSLANIIVEAIDKMVSFFSASGACSVGGEDEKSANASADAGNAPAHHETGVKGTGDTLRAIYLEATVSILATHGADRIIELLADWGEFQHRERETPGSRVWLRLALMVTAYLGRVSELNVLLQLPGVELHPASLSKEDWIFPPLMSAGLGGYFNTVKLLVREGDSLEYRSSSGGENILHFAALGGHVKLVRFVLRGWDGAAEAVNSNGHTPLVWALASGQMAVARELLEWRNGDPKRRKKQTKKQEKKTKKKQRSAEIITTPDKGTQEATATEAAVLFRFALRSQKLDPIIDAFPRILEQEETLIAVAEWGTPKQLRHLLSVQKTPMTYRSDAGATILHHAIYSGNPEKVRLMLEQPGVNVNAHAAASLEEETPLHAACGQTPDIVNLLIARRDVDPISLDSKGRTPLMVAADWPRHDICDLLLRELSGATEIWQKDIEGRNLLSIAAAPPDEWLIRRLLELAPSREVVSEAVSDIDVYLAGPKWLPKKLEHLCRMREAQQRVREGTYKILVQYREEIDRYSTDARG
ncbi:hypothetical protein BJX65DRAFT_312296 [Aspergillus insuetus]